MKRVRIDIEDVATFNNLCLAAVNAGKGKRDRRVVKKFFENFSRNISVLRDDILLKNAPYGNYKVFSIFDPKRREIYAPCFRDRIVHHALINFAGPVIDKLLVDSTFACRKGKGPLEAVTQAQKCIREYPWFVKIDIRRYFDSIDHRILKNLLQRKIKGNRVSGLMGRILGSYRTLPGKGLPIGALTSQYFANYYLNNVDRFILDQKEILAHTRYMDDIVWWCQDREAAKNTYKRIKKYIESRVSLEIKEDYQINRSVNGLTFCGFRIFEESLRLTRRKKVRFSKRLSRWESAFLYGLVHENKLQSAYSSVHSIVSNADSEEWRKSFFRSRRQLEV